MLDRPLVAEFLPDTPVADSLLKRLAPGDPRALQHLLRSFEAGQAATVMVGEGRARLGRVIDSFIAGLGKNTDVVRVVEPGEDVTDFMRDVIRKIGFEPKDFGLTDLDNIFNLFLSFQQTHARRTVLCLEEAQDCSPWLLERVCELVSTETEDPHGLMVVLCGQPDLVDLLQQEPLQYIAGDVGRPVRVAPLAPGETRDFIKGKIESEGVQDVGQIIEFEAIRRLHELSAGVLDTVSSLCSKSLQLATDETGYPITADTVRTAAISLGLISEPVPEAVHSETPLVAVTSMTTPTLVFRQEDTLYGERPLDSDCVSIGRDQDNDICIPSLTVSRHHALILTSAEGVKIVDLGSTNGTFVGHKQIESQVLKHGDTVQVGDCRMLFVTPDNDPDSMFSAELLGLREPRGVPHAERPP
jgi:type II secretory pathway predicted ATPase ExeA